MVMGIIEDFVSRYRKECEFYDQAARLVAQTVESNLQAAGIDAWMKRPCSRQAM